MMIKTIGERFHEARIEAYDRSTTSLGRICAWGALSPNAQSHIEAGANAAVLHALSLLVPGSPVVERMKRGMSFEEACAESVSPSGDAP